MEIKQLRSFVSVVEYGNFTKAADKNFTSQPTISTHIKALEDELGVKLIIRDTKNISITDKGRELYDTAVHILALQDKLITRWADENRNIVHLGVSTIPSAYILPEILAEFSKLHPEICFVIHQADSREIVDGLENGLYDLGLLGMDCNGEKLKSDMFYSDTTVLITPATDKYRDFKRHGILPVAQMIKEPFLFREKGSATQLEAENVLEQLGIDPDKMNVIARINDQETIKNLVEAGIGLSLSSKLAVQSYEKQGRLLTFELPDIQSTRHFYMAVNKQSFKNNAVKAFMKYIKRTYQ